MNPQFASVQLLDVQDMLGILKLSKSTLLRYIDDGRVPQPIYIGRSPQWHLRTVEQWLEETHRVKVRRAPTRAGADDLL